MNKWNITISSNWKNVLIGVEDQSSFCPIVEIEIDFSIFSKILVGTLAHQNCSYNISNIDKIWKERIIQQIPYTSSQWLEDYIKKNTPEWFSVESINRDTITFVKYI